MKMKIGFILVLLMAGCWYFFPGKKVEKKVDTSNDIIIVGSIEIKKELDIQLVDDSRRPAGYKEIKKTKLNLRHHKFKTGAPRITEINDGIVLPGGLQVLPHHYSVKENEFNENMGEVVRISNNIVIFRADSPVGANVAYDRKNNAYYPISSILKIEGVNNQKREDLINQGMQEYYYQEALQVMFIQSSHERILTHYEEAQAQGLKASLEVIKGFHRSR